MLNFDVRLGLLSEYSSLSFCHKSRDDHMNAYSWEKSPISPTKYIRDASSLEWMDRIQDTSDLYEDHF